MSTPLIRAGSLRVAFDNVDIRAVFENGCFGSLLCSLTSPALSRSTNRMTGGILRHVVINRSITSRQAIAERRTPECRITDLPFPDSPILIRMIETLDDISFRICPAEGVSLRVLYNYKIGNRKSTVAVLSRKENSGRRRLLCFIPTEGIYFHGEHPYPGPENDTPSKDSLYIVPGLSALIMIAGDSLADIMPIAAKLIKQHNPFCPPLESAFFLECNKQWNNRLSVMNPSLHDSLIEEGALHLLAHIDSDGKILDKEGYPLPFADTPPIIECLARLGFAAEAKAIADRIYIHAQAHGFTLGFNENLSCTYPAISAPAAFADAQLAYYHATHDVDFLKERIPLLIKAAMTMREELTNHLLCFGGDERIFSYRILHPRAIEQASATATLRFIRIVETILCFVKEHKLRSRKGYFEALTESCTLVKRAFLRDFVNDSILWENNLRRLRHTRSPRYLYGSCEVCGKMDYLERMGDRHNEERPYVCLDCIGQPMPKQNEKVKLPATAALLLSRGVIPNRKFIELACLHADRFLEEELASTEGGTWGILLRVIAELPTSDDLYERLKKLYERTLSEGVIRAGYYRMGTPLYDKGDPSATALCTLGLLAAESVL